MQYGLTKPCKKCPFRSDVKPYIRASRCAEILASDGFFACHETTDHDDDGEVLESEKDKKGWQHCAGFLIIRERENNPNQCMRIAERLGVYDRTKLKMNSPVYKSTDEAINAHALAAHNKRKSKHGERD